MTLDPWSWRLAAQVLGGAALGYGYYRLVGCRSGTCPLTSRWWTSAGYGALMAYLAASG